MLEWGERERGRDSGDGRVEADIGEGSCAFRGWKGGDVVELTSEDRLTVTVALDDVKKTGGMF